MPIADFYTDFARANFGESVAVEAGAIMAGVDGVKMPKVTDWKGGPGTIVANAAPWQKVKEQFAFVESFAKLRAQIRGAGNHARFDYWLNTYRAAEAVGQIGCLRGELDRAVGAMKGKKPTGTSAKEAAEALAVRVKLAQVWGQLLSYQTAATDTPGEMGTIANLEMLSRRTNHLFEAHDKEISEALGAPLPAEATPSTHFDGAARIIVPTVRTQIDAGESLKLKVIVLDNQDAKTATLFWRELGHGGFQKVDLTHVARSVYSVSLPAAGHDCEYYISAKTAAGENLVWPPTAPAQNQTVVISEARANP